MTKVWKARETVIKIDAAADVSIDNSAALDTFFSNGTAITAYAKNVTIVEPEGAVEKIDLLGETSNFQNAEFDEKPYGLASISGTLVQIGGEPSSGDILEHFAFGAGTAISTTHTRFQAGSSESGKTRVDCAVLVNLSDGTNEVNIVLDNAKVTKLGDRRISGPDGHWEQDFTIVCLPKDFYIELKKLS